MIAHIAKLTNAVVAIEKDEPFILKYVLVIEILFNMSYNQIINKMWLNERRHLEKNINLMYNTNFDE